MANNKRFVVQNGLETQSVTFVGSNNEPTFSITQPSDNVLSIEKDGTQLFSTNSDQTGTIFSVNDSLAYPLVEVDNDGTIRFCEFNGNVLLGTNVDDGTHRLQVNGLISDATNSSADWNTAFSWGDHSLVGYYINGAAGFQSVGIDDNALSTTVTLDDQGRVGIGTTTPAEKLQVEGNVSVDNSLKFNNNSVYRFQYTIDPNENLRLYGSTQSIITYTDDITGTIFSVNDGVGTPIIEVDADASVRIIEEGGSLVIGNSISPQNNATTIYGDVDVGKITVNNIYVEQDAIAARFVYSEQSNLPKSRPSLASDFLNSDYLDPRYVVSRSSTATYVGKDGFLRIANENEPRFDYDPATLEPRGLLVEETRTNLIPYSEDFTQWLSTGVTITPGNQYAPDNTLTATKITQDGTTGNHVVYVNDSTGASMSIFVKKAESRYVMIAKHESVSAGGDKGAIVLDLDTATVTETIIEGSNFVSKFYYTIDEWNDGWYRVFIATDRNDYGSWFSISPVPTATGNAYWPSYTGDDTSGVYIWGAQSEAGRFVSSYIPTEGSTKTRSLDLITMNEQYLDDDLISVRRAPASVFIEYSRYYDFSVSPNTDRLFTFYYLTTNNSIQIRGDNSSQEAFYIVDGGTTWKAGGRDVPGKNVVSRAAVGWDYTTSAISFDGSDVATGLSGIPFSARPTTLSIGSYGAYSSTPVNGHIRAFHLYPTKLSDAELIALSKG